MPDRGYAKFLEVLGSQFQQNRFIDFIVSEGLLIALQAKVAQLRRDVHMAPALRRRDLSDLVWVRSFR